MTNSRKNTLLVLGGALIGAAATYFAGTPKGQELISKAKRSSVQLGNNITSKAQAVADLSTEKASQAISKANEYMFSAQEILAENAVNALEKAEVKVNGFQQGINKAKRTIQNGSSVS